MNIIISLCEGPETLEREEYKFQKRPERKKKRHDLSASEIQKRPTTRDLKRGLNTQKRDLQNSKKIKRRPLGFSSQGSQFSFRGITLRLHVRSSGCMRGSTHIRILHNVTSCVQYLRDTLLLLIITTHYYHSLLPLVTIQYCRGTLPQYPTLQNHARHLCPHSSFLDYAHDVVC